MILPRGSYEGNWKMDVLKPAGVKFRELIRFYNTTDKSFEDLSFKE